MLKKCKVFYEIFIGYFIFVQIKLKIMDLFVVQNGKAMPSVHALIIEPFKSIWNNDPDPAKGEAIRAFSFIELCCSPKKSNPYWGYDEDVRYQVLKEELYGDRAYQLPGLVIDGITKYENLLNNSSPSYSILRSALSAAEQLKAYLNNIDLGARTNSGAAVYKPKDVTTALKDLPDVAKNVELLRTRVQKEMLEEAKTRNNREVGYFEE